MTHFETGLSRVIGFFGVHKEYVLLTPCAVSRAGPLAARAPVSRRVSAERLQDDPGLRPAGPDSRCSGSSWYGWDEIGSRLAAVFLVLWTAGWFGYALVPHGDSLFASYRLSSSWVSWCTR
jgi:hypothetical protein